MELVHERRIAITDDDGKAYAAVRVFAYPQPVGTWAGILEFLPADGGPGIRSERETTQSSPDAVAYWATGLEPLYFEGALARARREPVAVMPASAPALGPRRVARIEVASDDLQLPLRVMSTRTLVRGFRRRVHDAGTLVYEGTTRAGACVFRAEFRTENAAALIANVVWSEARTVRRITVEGRAVDNTHAALKDALVAATEDRRAG